MIKREGLQISWAAFRTFSLSDTCQAFLVKKTNFLLLGEKNILILVFDSSIITFWQNVIVFSPFRRKKSIFFKARCFFAVRAISLLSLLMMRPTVQWVHTLPKGMNNIPFQKDKYYLYEKYLLYVIATTFTTPVKKFGLLKHFPKDAVNIFHRYKETLHLLNFFFWDSVPALLPSAHLWQ